MLLPIRGLAQFCTSWVAAATGTVCAVCRNVGKLVKQMPASANMPHDTKTSCTLQIATSERWRLC